MLAPLVSLKVKFLEFLSGQQAAPEHILDEDKAVLDDAPLDDENFVEIFAETFVGDTICQELELRWEGVFVVRVWPGSLQFLVKKW